MVKYLHPQIFYRFEVLCQNFAAGEKAHSGFYHKIKEFYGKIVSTNLIDNRNGYY